MEDRDKKVIKQNLHYWIYGKLQIKWPSHILLIFINLNIQILAFGFPDSDDNDDIPNDSEKENVVENIYKENRKKAKSIHTPGKNKTNKISRQNSRGRMLFWNQY